MTKEELINNLLYIKEYKSNKKSNIIKKYKKEINIEIKKNKIDNDIKLTEKAFILINNMIPQKCSICKKQYKFISFEKGYKEYCTLSCEKKKTNNYKEKKDLITYLYSLIQQNQQNKDIIIFLYKNLYLSSLYKYTGGLENKFSISERIYILMNKKVNNKCNFCKTKKTKFKNSIYGYFDYCSNSCSFKATNEKRKKTNIEKYGVKNVLMMKKNKEKRQIVFSKNQKEIRNKIEETNKNRFGYKNASKKNEIREKIKKSNKNKTNIEKDIIKTKIKITKLKKEMKYGNDYYKQIYKENGIKNKKNTIKRKIKEIKLNNIIPLFKEDDYIGVKSQKYKWKCLICNKDFSQTLDDGKIVKCINCNKLHNKSLIENEIYEYIKEKTSKNIEINNRKLLKGLEIDILIDSNIGIELNGDYFHSYDYLNKKKITEKMKKRMEKYNLKLDLGKNYHLIKSLIAEEINIKLLHINEYEWKNKRTKDIWKSIISKHIKKQINIKDFIIKKLNKKFDYEIINSFIYENYLLEYDLERIEEQSAIYGMFKNQKLLSLMILENDNIKIHFDKKNTNYNNTKEEFKKYINRNNYIQYIDCRFEESEKNKIEERIKETKLIIKNNNKIYNAGYMKIKD